MFETINAKKQQIGNGLTSIKNVLPKAFLKVESSASADSPFKPLNDIVVGGPDWKDVKELEIIGTNTNSVTGQDHRQRNKRVSIRKPIFDLFFMVIPPSKRHYGTIYRLYERCCLTIS